MASISAFSGSSRHMLAARTSRARVVTHASQTFKTITPAGDRVLVKQDKPEARTIGGVLLPSTTQKQSNTGEVISLGDAAAVKVGERVVFSKFAGTEIDISGDNHIILKEEDVIGKLSKGEKIPKLQPLFDRILIQKAKASDKSAGGVLLMSDSSEKPTFGEVLQVGEGRKSEESGAIVKPNVAAGQTVLYSKYSGTEFEEDGNEYIVVRENDILAVLA